MGLLFVLLVGQWFGFLGVEAQERPSKQLITKNISALTSKAYECICIVDIEYFVINV